MRDMLTLEECTPTQLRAIADFADNPMNFSPLIEAKIAPVIEQGQGKLHDRLIGWESIEEWDTIMDGDEVVGYSTPCPPDE